MCENKNKTDIPWKYRISTTGRLIEEACLNVSKEERKALFMIKSLIVDIFSYYT